MVTSVLDKMELEFCWMVELLLHVKVWRAMSPWIVHAKLKLAFAGQCLATSLGQSHDVFISVVCMYAPTGHAPSDMVKYFYDDLQNVLSNIPPNDLLLMLGDLNSV